MKILIVTDAYPPETRSSSHLMKEMADGLRERGHEVFVVTSRPAAHNIAAGTSTAAGVSEEDGITVIRVSVLPHHNVGFIVKGIAQLFLPYLFFRQVRRHVKGRIDAVWVHSPPLPLTITARMVQRTYGARYFLNLQDFFPQNALDLGVLQWWKHWPAIFLFKLLEGWAYRDSDIVVTPSEQHKQYMHEKRGIPMEKIHVVSHWIDVRPYIEAKRTGKFRERYGLKDKFIFVFGGILGPSQGLEMFLRIARHLKEKKDLMFLFVGEGSEKGKLMAVAERDGLTNVMFQPLVSKEEYPRLLKDADVGILSLTSANTTPAVPAKLMGYLAASLPVLAFLHRESAGIQIVEEARCGFAAVSDDEEAMLAAAERMYREKESLAGYGANGFRYLMAHFTKDICVGQIEKLIRSS